MALLVITVGNKNFDNGQTTVTIDADGNVCASNNTLEKIVNCETKLEQEVISTFLKSLSSRKLLKLKLLKLIGGKRNPDEAKYVFEIKENKKSRKIEIWDNELRKIEDFYNSLKILRRLIYKLSEQKILL